MSTANKLRPYQLAAVKAALAAIGNGKSGLIHIATGGGKTVVAAELIRQVSTGYVLWLTKDWTLLEQAAATVALQSPDLVLGRVGGETSGLISLEDSPDGADVIFTTLHTFVRRLEAATYPYDDRPGLIVWDECHWGEGSPMGRGIVAFAKAHGTPILGLTATPRGYSKLPTLHRTTFLDLIRLGFLANPVIVPAVETGVDWTPNRTSDEGDFTGASLRELAENDERNALIVDHWRTHARQYESTIVFACNIDHAECLSNLFKDVGASVGVVHCDLDGHENRAEIDQYKSGALDVIINVAMLTHGFDAPRTRTILLTRPTASPVLYAQMIGRGSRIAPEKQEFYIVEFTDNVHAHHGSVLHPESILWDGPGSSTGGHRKKREAFEHQFKAEGRLINVSERSASHAALSNLRYRQGQTFGIEVELTRANYPDPQSDEWASVATSLLALLRMAVGDERVADAPYVEYHDSQLKYDVWNVEYDRTCGWEIIGPKLCGLDGFREVALACDAITDAVEGLNLTVNHNTGLHVHFGWTGEYRSLQHVIAGTHELEPLLASIVAPSRVVMFEEGEYDRGRPNTYCAPVASVNELRSLAKAKTSEQFAAILAEMDDESQRYTTVNLIPMLQQSTVEVRWHGGTTEAAKILLWISLWMQLLHRFEALSASGIEPARLKARAVVEPKGCIVSWLFENIQSVSVEFLQRVQLRREVVRNLWAANHELRAWIQSARDWRTIEDLSDAAE